MLNINERFTRETRETLKFANKPPGHRFERSAIKQTAGVHDLFLPVSCHSRKYE